MKIDEGQRWEAGLKKLTINRCLAAASRASFSAVRLSSRMQTSQVQNSKSSCSWACSWACRFMRRLRRNIVADKTRGTDTPQPRGLAFKYTGQVNGTAW